MALQSHLHHCRRPPPPLMSYNNHKTRSVCLVHLSPPLTARFCTRTGSGALPVRRITGLTRRSRRRGLTVFSGMGSIEQTSLQLFTHTSLSRTVVWVLRGGWIALILPILFSCKIDAFHQMLLSFSGRGKIMEPSSSKKLSVPKKFFCHFYILGCAWTTFLLVTTWMYANAAYQTQTESGIWSSVFLLLFMEAQVLRRLFESIYVFKCSPSARMHIVIYLTGLFFYIAAPLSLCCKFSSELFHFVTSSFKGMQITEFDFWGHVIPLMQLNWCVWIGAAVFFWGWIHQRRCHAILGSLRDNKRKENEYVIPHGDWFEYVSSPHYLAEIVMYGGLVIASGCSDITIWLVFGIVVANLTFSAAQTHKWYLGKFNNYPKTRYAIIPFIY